MSQRSFEPSEDTFRKMFGITQEPSKDAAAESEKPISNPTPQQQVTSQPAVVTLPPAASAGDPRQAPTAAAKSTTPPKGLKFYLSPELDNALARRCYRDRSMNRSAHVRAALEEYLKEDLDALREGRP